MNDDSHELTRAGGLPVPVATEWVIKDGDVPPVLRQKFRTRDPFTLAAIMWMTARQVRLLEHVDSSVTVEWPSLATGHRLKVRGANFTAAIRMAERLEDADEVQASRGG